MTAADHTNHRPDVRLDGIAIGRPLGRGGTATVYEGYDRRNKRRVALKLYPGSDVVTVARVQRIVDCVRDLRHPNVVELYDFIAAGDWAVLAMELVEGTDFLSYCQPHQPPMTTGADAVAGPGPPRCDLARLRQALPQLAAGLRALHMRDVIHRDVKPDNVRVTPEGRVVVIDFSLSIADTEHVQGGGTVSYMAPEQADSQQTLSSSADWYAFGALLYHVLSGRVPFSGPPLRVLQDKLTQTPTPIDELVDTPSDLAALCNQLLDPEPEQRPSDTAIARSLGLDTSSWSQPTPPAEVEPPGLDESTAREAARLAQAFATSARRQCSLVVINGAAGTGKSQLLAAAAGQVRAHHADVVVLTTSCVSADPLGLDPFRRIADQLADVLQRNDSGELRLLFGRERFALAAMWPVLARIPGIDSDDDHAPVTDHQARRTAGLTGLREVLSQLARRRPVMLCVDDIHRADTTTLETLAEVFRPPDQPPLQLVVTGPEDLGEAAPVLAGMHLDGITILLAESAPAATTTTSDTDPTTADAAPSGRDAERAGREAMARMQYHRAVACFERAAPDDSDTSADAVRIRTALAEALSAAGRCGDAAQLYLQLAGQGSSADRVRWTSLALQRFVLSGRVDRALEVLQSLLDQLGLRLAPTPRRALLAIIRRVLWRSLAGTRWRRAADDALPAARLAEAEAMTGTIYYLGLIDPLLALDVQTQALSRALKLGAPEPVGRMLVFTSLFLASQNQQTRAERYVEQAADIARREGSTHLRMFAHLGRAGISYFCRSAWRDAVDQFGQLVAFHQTHPNYPTWELDVARTYACFALLYEGKITEASRRVFAYLREAERAGDAYASFILRTRMNTIWLARDDEAGARAALDQATRDWTLTAEGFHVQHQFLLTAECELLRFQGRAAEAQQRLDAHMERLERSKLLRVNLVAVEVFQQAARIAVTLAGSTSDTDTRRRQLRRARAARRRLVKAALPMCRPIVALLDGVTQHLAGDTDGAAVTLASAAQQFDDLGMGLSARACRVRVGELRGGNEGEVLIGSALHEMRQLGAANPSRLVELIVPAL